MTDNPRYNPHRKHRYWSQDHKPTASQRRLVRRLDRARRANQQDRSFGKINWAAYDHQQLWDMVQSSDPATMGTAAYRWAQLAVGVDTVTTNVHQTVQKLLMSWRGGSAVTAAESASKLTKWGAGACDTMRHVGDGLDQYTSALLDARNHMPEPVYYSEVRHFREGYDIKAGNGPSAAILADQLLDDHLPTQRQASNAKAEAVRVMERYEAGSKHVHDKLPHFTDAPEPVAGRPGGPAQGAEQGTDRGSGTAPDGTVAASAVSVPGGEVGMTGSGSTIGSVPGGGIGTGSGVGSGSALGAGSTSGSGFGTAAASAAQGGAAAARGAGPGGMGMYPGGMGAGRPGGSDDDEHTNRYAEQRGLDLLDDLPPAYPPVLGE
ncbi:PPE domain-containing protein [Amycolatopsis sp. NPDC059027]|uniref:PPE domain-containing protein n=1 Tax=Amycolatopsis sp. NPDC059027 TaxID=3346709 RepID=UPI00366E90C4